MGHVIEDPFNVHVVLAGSGWEDMLIIEGSQHNLCEDVLERLPGISTRLKPEEKVGTGKNGASDNLDFDFAEFHEDWKKDAVYKASQNQHDDL